MKNICSFNFKQSLIYVEVAQCTKIKNVLHTQRVHYILYIEPSFFILCPSSSRFLCQSKHWQNLSVDYLLH